MATRAMWQADARSDDELVAAAIAEAQLSDEDYAQASGAYAVLLWRSGPELLRRAIDLTASESWIERGLGVDLLGHIHDPGFRDVDAREAWATSALRNGYLDESLAALRALTATERHPEVIESLAHAYCGREDPRGIAPLAHLATHELAAVREAAARALPMCGINLKAGARPAEVEEARAAAERIAGPLIVLADDPEGDVRDWALFGLHLGELDTPEIRDTFVAHIDDPHHDAMTEALYGLANLGDLRGLEPLRHRIESGDDPRILIEACELYGDERLVPGLQALRDDAYTDDHDELDAALATCRKGRGWQGPSIGHWRPAAKRG